MCVANKKNNVEDLCVGNRKHGEDSCVHNGKECLIFCLIIYLM